MGVTVEGGSQTSQQGQYEARKINDVVLSNGDHPPFINRAHFVDHAARVGINYERLPQLPFFAGFYGYSESWYKSVIGADLMRLSVAAGRALTPEEAHHIAYHSAKKCYTTTYYNPTVAGITSIFFLRGFNNYKFPFYEDKSGTLINRITTRTGIPRNIAHWLVHAGRLATYNLMTRFCVGVVFTSYPGLVFAVGMAQDRNLESFGKEIAQRLRTQRAAGQGPRYEIPHTQGPVDDNSPTAGSEKWVQDTPQSEFGQDEQQDQPEQSQQRGWQPQRSSPPSAPASAPELLRAPEPSSQYDEDDAYLFDDASPVAQTQRKPHSGSAGSGGGSAWSRLRSRAQGAGAQGEQSTPGGSSSDESSSPPVSSWEARRQSQRQQAGSYTYSQEEVDRAAGISKEQAQKEFDAMLERERSGK